MGKSEILVDGDGLEFWWNSEDHRPPHFHVSSSDGVWEIRVRFWECEADKLEYEFKFPSTRKNPIPKADEKKILDKMKGPKGLIMKRQLFKEWLDKVVTKDNHIKR